MSEAPEKWTFDEPYSAVFHDGLDGKWLRLMRGGNSVASFSVKNWGGEQECIEAAWRFAYEPQPDPDAAIAELVGALRKLANRAEYATRYENDKFNFGWMVTEARALIAKYGDKT